MYGFYYHFNNLRFRDSQISKCFQLHGLHFARNVYLLCLQALGDDGGRLLRAPEVCHQGDDAAVTHVFSLAYLRVWCFVSENSMIIAML